MSNNSVIHPPGRLLLLLLVLVPLAVALTGADMILGSCPVLGD